MIHPTFIVDDTAPQLPTTPASNEDRTQHQPEGSGLMTAVLIAIIAGFIVSQIT